ncbi:MAG: dienelactone hydrolase family protein [Microcella sp.]|uniref:alpha/beta hydrolase n=1 Tax=Microcella sp. TaxID=1913979 RepID=UPI0024CBD18A|nr:alpha/beta hydrolase-fold protein [Microcella sp.]UYN83263.1 MAG: dienelactone hydrolase family protein [Microcella sp.]
MTEMQLIDETAVLWSAPESERADRPLLVLLHGYGSHEGDLFGLAPHLPLQPVIASLRAPLRAGPGYAWYDLEGASNESRSDGANAAARGVLHWLDSVQATSVGLLGFSQGGAMSIQLMRHAPERFAFAVSLAGFVVPGPAPADARLSELAPPVFWGRGTHDTVIPDSFVTATQRWLPHHATLTERIYEGLEHAVSEAELADVLTFMREQYP